MTTAPPTAPPSPPVSPDPTRALPSSPPFIPIGQKNYTPRSIFLPRGVHLWPGFGNCLCAAVVGCLVDLIMGCLFGRLNTLFCIPLGCGLWDACGEKSVQPKISFTTHRASNFDEHFGPAAAEKFRDFLERSVRKSNGTFLGADLNFRGSR